MTLSGTPTSLRLVYGMSYPVRRTAGVAHRRLALIGAGIALAAVFALPAAGAARTSSIRTQVSGKVYWGQGRTIWTTHLDGSGRRQVAAVPQPISTGGLFNDLAIANGAVYFSDGSTIGRVGADGRNPRALVRSRGISFLQVSGGRLYWSDGAIPVIRSANLNGQGRRVVIRTASEAGSLAGLSVDHGNVYWINANSDGSETLMRVRTTGGTPETLFTLAPAGATNRGGAEALRIADDYAYWIDKSRAIDRAKLDGSGKRLIARASAPYKIWPLVLGPNNSLVWVSWRWQGQANVAKIYVASRTGLGPHVALTSLGVSGAPGASAITATS